MATPDRSTTGNLNEALLSEVLARGRQFDFYQAVRVLLALHPEAATPGGHGQLSKEAVRFCANPSLGFPASDIESVRRETGRPDTGCRVRPRDGGLRLWGLGCACRGE